MKSHHEICNAPEIIAPNLRVIQTMYLNVVTKILTRYIKIENVRTEEFRKKNIGQKTFGRFFRNFGQNNFRSLVPCALSEKTQITLVGKAKE